MDRFEIDQIFPLHHDGLWAAKIVIHTPETIKGVEVGQNALLTVRFEYPADQPVSGLLEAATRKAEECLTSATVFLSGRSASELLSAVRAEHEAQEAEWKRPLKLPATSTET